MNTISALSFKVLASAIPGSTFAAKLQYAAGNTIYPVGTVFDFSAMNGPQSFGPSQIAFNVPGQTFIFGAGTYTYTGTRIKADIPTEYEVLDPLKNNITFCADESSNELAIDSHHQSF